MGRVGYALAVIIAIAGSTSLAPAQVPAPPAPAPTQGLLRGSEHSCTIVYEAQPKLEWELRYNQGGRENQRLWIGPKAAQGQARVVRYWHQAQGFGLDLQSGRSQALSGAERAQAFAQLELRRALIAFESFAWKTEAQVRRLELVLPGESTPIGELRASAFDASSQRPQRLEFLPRDGGPADSYRELRWTAGERPQLQAAELWHGETRIWRESQYQLEARTFTPEYFVPPDRRAAGAPRDNAVVVSTQVPEHALRRLELPAGTTLEQAREQLQRWREEWTEKLSAQGLKLENKATLELDQELRPIAVLLRLDQVPSELPLGFEKRPATQAFALQVPGFAALPQTQLAALLERLPAAERARARPYLRWLLAPGGEEQLLLLVSAAKG